MFTLHHGFWLYFFTRRQPQVWQFVIGSMLPDYIYVVLLGYLLLQGQLALTDVLDLGPGSFMGYIPVYPWAMYGDLIGHSVVFWGAAFLASLLPVANRLQPLTIGWGSHLFIDGITHAAHANFFLYPISLVAVHSPVSYWEPEYYAWEFRIVNGILMGLTAMYLVYYWWRKHRQK